MRLAFVIALVGYQVRWFALALLAPIALAVWDRHWWTAADFAVSMLCAVSFGMLTRPWYVAKPQVYREEALAIVAFTWFSISVFSALPYVCAGLPLTDALFESMSGLTTTGATILTDFSRYDRPFFLWRAMTQWFGGLGVIALFVVVLPRLGIAGRQLFFAEASGVPSEAVSPQIRDTAGKLWIVYSGLTGALVGLLYFGGMTLYDSVLHALTTLAAGGFSPNPESIAGYVGGSYDGPFIQWVLCLFMLLAGTSYTLQYKAFTGRPLSLFRDGEFLFYLGVALVASFGLACILSGGLPDRESARASLFQVTSLISSTGFASTDYNLWADSARTVLIVVMLLGGCAGSAAGGPKAIRFLLVFKYSFRELKRVIHPRAVLPLRYKRRSVPEDVMRSVFMLVVFYMVGHFVIGALLVLQGYDLVLGFSAALACLGNIGPGFGAAGPMGSFAEFSDPAKWLLTAAMWIGRLEIVTVLALLHPDVLRHLRLKG